MEKTLWLAVAVRYIFWISSGEYSETSQTFTMELFSSSQVIDREINNQGINTFAISAF